MPGASGQESQSPHRGLSNDTDVHVECCLSLSTLFYAHLISGLLRLRFENRDEHPAAYEYR